MPRVYRSFTAFLATFSLLTVSSAWGDAAQREKCEREYAPRSGQAGKDVIWVPTQEELVMAMLKAAQVTKDDYVIDLGSGDGRIPIAAAKHFGARAMGIEYNPEMVKLAQCYVRAEGVQDKVTIKQADIFETDFSDATVLTMYLLSDLNMKLRPTILKMKPGTRVVSNSFKMGEWSPDQNIDPESGYTRGYLWIVPADVEGKWTFDQDGGGDAFEMNIEQEFQEIKASTSGDSAPTVQEAQLRGADIQLTLLDANKQPHIFKGNVAGDRMRLTGRKGGQPVTYVGERR